MAATHSMFSDADRQLVAMAIRDAEAATSAEIVPVVARCSGRYDRAEDIVGLWFAALAMIAVWLAYPLPNAEPGDWASLAPVWQLAALVAGMLAGFVVGALIGERVDWLRRLFTPRTQMTAEVYGRARSVFFDKRVHHTAGGAGVLLYVSLFERMAAVIADQSVLDKLGQSQVDDICREFTRRLHDASPTVALCETAVLLGQRLAPLLPRAANDSNELSDVLVVID